MNTHVGVEYTDNGWVRYSPGWTEPHNPYKPGAWAARPFIRALMAYHEGNMSQYNTWKEWIATGAYCGRYWNMLEMMEANAGRVNKG